MTILEDEDDDE